MRTSLTANFQGCIKEEQQLSERLDILKSQNETSAET